MMERVLPFILFLLAGTTFADPPPVPDDTPGFESAAPPETGYAHGRMDGDAEARALEGRGYDGEAARAVIGGFTRRPDTPIDEREDWTAESRRAEETPGDFVTIMKDTYSDCTGGTATEGTPGENYVHACEAPAVRSKYACRQVLAPRCADPSRACMRLTRTDTGILPFHFDGERYIYIGNRGRDSIRDRGHRTTQHFYVAELQFMAKREEVAWFTLERLEYEDFVEVTFNGVPVFTDLDRRQYAKVKTCGGCHVINRPVSRTLNFDLRPYLKDGLNTFRVRLTAVAHGNLWLKLDTDSRCCLGWDNDWVETCR